MFVDKKNKDNITVWRVDKAKKIYEYIFRFDTGQTRTINKAIFVDYKKKPTNLNENGYGFARAMKPFFRLLKDTLQDIDFIEVRPNIKNSIKKSGSKFRIYFNKDQYEAFAANVTEVYRENSTRLTEVSKTALFESFGKKYFPKTDAPRYRKNTLKTLLQEKDIINKLSVEDIKSIASILPALFDKSASLKQKILDKIFFVDLKKKLTASQLNAIITEFESLLKKKKQDENEWQDFLRRHMLTLNPGYVGMLEKKNISIQVSIPDFMAIDQFQYLDVIEIKRPDFKPLLYDDSHKTYYWGSEASKAIAQVENYIVNLETHSHSIINAFSEDNVDLNIIRPRGIVIIGKRSDYENNKKALKAFRLLNEAMMRVNVVFFDDYLSLFRSRYAKIKK